jgi:hypothetical protein
MKEIIGTVYVVSKRWSGTQSEKGDVVVDADRSNPLLGNRSHMQTNSLAERERVIAENNIRVDSDLLVGGPISVELDRLADMVMDGQHVALACHCAPCLCHADRYALEILRLVKAKVT